MGTRVCAFYFVVGLLVPALAGTSLASPEPKPSATPNVWVDQDLARDCELHVPCVQSVQLAVNIVDPSGSVFVYALPWSYNESVTVSKPVSVTGQNRSVVIDGRGAQFVFNVTANDVLIQNLTVMNGGAGVAVIGAAGTAVRNVTATGVGNGVGIQDAIGTVVRDSLIQNPSNLGLGFLNSSNITVNNVTVDGGGALGIWARSVNSLEVTASTVVHTAPVAVQIAGSAHLRLELNNVSANFGRGLWVDGSREVVVRGNTIQDNALTGLNVSASSNVTVDGNLIDGNGGLGIPPRSPIPGPRPLCCNGGGGWFWQTDPVLIANNTFVANQFFGLQIGGNGSTDYVITGNRIAGTVGQGLVLTEDASRIDVTGTFDANAGDGIAMDNVTGVSVHEALVRDNGGAGVDAWDATSVTVTNSTVTGNLGPNGALRYWRVDQSQVLGSAITGNTGPGVHLQETAIITVADNVVSGNGGAGLLFDRGLGSLVTGNRLGGSTRLIDDLGGFTKAARNIFSDASTGVFLHGRAGFTTNNDTFSNVTTAFALDEASRAIALNDSFGGAGQVVADIFSLLTVEWFLHVSVVDADGSAAPGATVRVLDTSRVEVFNGTADGNGRKPWIILSEFDETGDGVFAHTPHDARAYVTGPDEGAVAVAMDASKNVTIRLVRDVTPPAIGNLSAIPDPQEQGRAVDVSATVQDAHLASVFLNVTYPDGSSVNASMIPAGVVYELNRTYGQVGTHAYTIIARDTFGNAATASGTFRIVAPNAPPSITNANAAPDPAEAGASANITATIQDPDGIAAATVSVRFPDNSVVNANLVAAGGNVWYFARTYGLLGSYGFTITATDANATSPKSSTAIGGFTVRDSTAPVANAGPNQTVPQGTLVFFDGSGSSDSNTVIVNYTWAIAGLATVYGVTPTYRFAQRGVWRVTLTVRDLGGNTATDDLFVTVLDVTRPTISNVVANPSPAESPGQTTISFTATDDNSVTLAHVEAWSPNGMSLGNVSVLVTPNVVAPSTWILTALGSYRFAIYIEDQSGNWAAVELQVLARDTTAPSILAVGADPSPQQVGTPVTLWAQLQDSFLASVAVNVRDSQGAFVNNFTMSFNASSARHEANLVPTILGSYAFVVWALDTSSNVASAANSFVAVDAVPPTISAIVVSPRPQQVGGVVDVSAIVTDDVSLNTPQIAIFEPLGAPLGTFDMTFQPVDGRWHDARAYAQVGTYSFTILATDGSGNPAQASDQVPIVDVVAPTITGPTPSPPTWEVNGRITVTASIADDVAVGGVTLQVVDPSGATVSNATMTCDPTWRCTDTRAYGVAGTWVVRVWAADRSGNLASASTTIAIVPGADPVANAGPDVSIDAGATLTFNGSLSIDDYGIVAYEWTFTSEAVVRSLTGPTPRFRFDVPGTYVVTLTVRDVAGHADTDTVTVTVLAASPPPAETPFWYYAAAGLVLLFVVALVLGWIVRRHRAQQIAARRRELEAAEAEREAKRAARDAQARMPDEDEL